MNAFIATVRREHWESSAFWIVPGVFGVLMVISSLFGVFSLWNLGVDPADVRHGLGEFVGLGGAERREVLKLALLSTAVPFNMFLVGVMFFYSLDSLYGDRRDRSVLFWKSLPVSDLKTVLSKLTMALAVGPALTLVVIAVFHVVILLIGTAVMLWSGTDGWWVGLDPVALLATWGTLAWALLAQSLVYLPIVAWLMLASAWAKKAPFLWAVAPPVFVLIVESWVAGFNGRTVLGDWLAERVSSALPLALNVHSTGDAGFRFDYRDGAMSADGAIRVHFDLLWSWLLWEGVLIAVVLLSGAVFLRRYRADAE